jgi:Domain of unknown function (DUF4136)
MKTPLSGIHPPKLSALFETGFLKRFRHVAGINTALNATTLIAIAFLLGGCVGLRVVDSQVSAFSQFPQTPAAGAAWSFERLPSQQSLQEAAAARQSKLEAWVTQELSKQGFAAKPVAAGEAQYTVQLGVRIQRLEQGPFDDPHPWGSFGLARRDYVVTGTGRVIYLPIFPRHNLPWYVREFSLLIRDAKSNTVVYETRAKHEGRWADDEAVLPAMVGAALQGFPKPPEGPRIVKIEIPN